MVPWLGFLVADGVICSWVFDFLVCNVVVFAGQLFVYCTSFVVGRVWTFAFFWTIRQFYAGSGFVIFPTFDTWKVITYNNLREHVYVKKYKTNCYCRIRIDKLLPKQSKFLKIVFLHNINSIRMFGIYLDNIIGVI